MTNTKTKSNPSNMAAELGRRGGKANFKKRGKQGMSELGKRGADVRWSSKDKIN